MRTLVAGCCLATCLASCAPATPQWVKPGVTAEQLERDRDDCLARSQDYLATGDSKVNYSALGRCMAERGYTTAR